MEECRHRYETLQKAYTSMTDFSARTGRTFREITKEERLELKLATTLNEEWYKCIDAFSHKGRPVNKQGVVVVMVLARFQRVI